MNTVTLKRPADLPDERMPFVSPVSLDEATVLGVMRGAQAVYYLPKTRTAHFRMEPPKIMTREQYTEEWTVAEILKREG